MNKGEVHGRETTQLILFPSLIPTSDGDNSLSIDVLRADFALLKT